MTFRSAWAVLMLAVIWVAIPNTASAQVGVLGGYNSANINLDEGAESFIETESRGGFFGGLSLNIPVQEAFSVEVDALVSQKGSDFNFDGETGRIRLTYAELPVLARFNVPGSGSARVRLLAGPSFNYKLNESFEPNGSDEGAEDTFKKFETSLVFGAEVAIRSFRVGARYSMGLSDIFEDSSTDGAFNGKNKVFSVLVGFGS